MPAYTIAFDFDGVLAAKPAAWLAAASALKSAGCRVVCVTARPRARGAEVRAIVGSMPIVFCAGRQKRVAARGAGYRVDVWVDDHPERFTL